MSEGDQTTGRYVQTVQIKADAVAPDDVTKFAYSDDDYETVSVWVDYTDDELATIAAQNAQDSAHLDELQAIANLYAASTTPTAATAKLRATATTSPMVSIYAALVKGGRMTMDEVPESLRADKADKEQS